MNTRYLLSVLLLAVLMVASIYGYFKRFAYLDSLNRLTGDTKATTPALSTRAQEEINELDILREATKEQIQIIATTTIKKEATSLDLARKEAQKQVASSKTSPPPAKTAEQERQELDALRAQAQAQLTN